LPSAVEVVRSCDATNAGVTFDVWHFHRGGGVVGELSDDDLVYVRGVQLSDALAEPVGDPMAESISQRLMPGEGVIPFDTLIPRLVAAAPTATIGVEVFNTTYADRPTADVAREAMRTARAVFG
jgi:4-hydroxyphenylpyruvate dioxygenase